jgi:hypothetical protein
MTSGSEKEKEPVVILLLYSHFNDEMISNAAKAARFTDMLKKLLGFGVRVIFEHTDGPAVELEKLLGRNSVNYRSTSNPRILVIGDLLARRVDADYLADDEEINSVSLIDDIESRGDILLLNSFLLSDDPFLVENSDVLAMPADLLKQKTNWESTCYATEEDHLQGWLEWSGQMLKGIDHQASYLRWNKSRMANKKL